MSLANLKKSMQTNLSRIKVQAEQSEQASTKKADERFWNPTFDKEKAIGSATIRMLPAPEGEDMAFVKVYSHSFKGPTGKWYIENSLSSIGKRDAVGQINYKLWNSGIESDKTISSKQKRKTNYYANILVINDPAHPEFNGKVMLYKFGPKIFEMLNSKMFPEFEDVEAIDVFSPWDGADFSIRMTGTTMVGWDGKSITVPNYEKSTFRNPSVMGDDDFIESIWKQCHSLQEFLAPKNFKTEEELAKRLFEVLGPTVGSGIQTVEGFDVPEEPKKAAPKKVEPTESFDDVPEFEEPKVAPKKKVVPQMKEDDSDDDLDFLKSLME
jgi:hypothetical protein